MMTVLLIIHLLVSAGLVGLVLMQRSDGGALGIGGGGSGGMMSSRGAANVLTRSTTILGAAFFANSILLAIVAGVDSQGQSVFDNAQDDVPAFHLTIDVDDTTPTLPDDDG